MTLAFPDTEFWQCPSYTWSSIVLGVMVSIVIALAFLVNNDLGSLALNIGSIFLLFWMVRTFVHWISPDTRCVATGFPGQHYINPFYDPKSK